MKPPQVLSDLGELRSVPGPAALAVGVFDGLHRGHQEVVKSALEHARQHDGTAVVLTFDPHPKEVLTPAFAPKRLTPVAHQCRLLRDLGVGHVLVCPFTRDFAATPAADFIQALVSACRPLGCISVGYGWSFGKDRSGNVHALMDAGQVHGFAVYGVPPVKQGDRVISSTWLRECVSAGDFTTAGALLGRPFSLFGRIVPGRRLGRQLGFPTANVRTEAGLMPPPGVYVTQVRLEDDWLPAVSNLGRRPTVEEAGALVLEAHLLEGADDLYGREAEVRFLHQLRPEQKFDGLDALRAQIDRDRQAARDWFDGLGA